MDHRMDEKACTEICRSKGRNTWGESTEYLYSSAREINRVDKTVSPFSCTETSSCFALSRVSRFVLVCLL